LLLAATLSGEGAQASSTTTTVFGEKKDTGVLDLNGDGQAEWNTYGPTNNAVAVGEQRGDGMNLKYVVPFKLTPQARTLMATTASSKLRFRIWSVENVGDRQLVVEAFPGDLAGRDDFTRSAVEIARVKPVATLGGYHVDVDVTGLARYTAWFVSADVLTFRLSLVPPGVTDGVRTFVNVATMESSRQENRPQLQITVDEPTTTTQPPVTQPPVTQPPVTQPPVTQPPVTQPPVTQPPVTQPPVTQPPGGWRLTWSDEFNGSAVDMSKWSYDAPTYGDGNSEIACLRPENASVSNGLLKITARRQQVKCPNETRPAEFPNGRPWTSASINTSGKFSQAEGRFEIRAKLPRGKGFWPAFWMTSQSYPYGGTGRSGEIDVFEAFGQSPTALLTSVHWYYPSGSQCPSGRWGCSLLNKYTTVADMTTGFHVYAVEWEGNHIAWFFDGQKVFEIGDGEQYKWSSAAPKPGSFSMGYGMPFTEANPMKLKVNLAVGGLADSPDSSTPATGTYEVDYVRAYSR
jgi:beta-glucanase (GH16 family)